MKAEISITLTEDFYTLCTIYQIKPEALVQSFIDHVSLPSHYSNAMGSNRWATFCFLNFLDIEESKYDVNEDLEIEYLDLFYRAVGYDIEITSEEIVKYAESGRRVMRQWLKAVLAERAKYITDNL